VSLDPEAWGALATIGGAAATALGMWGAARAGAAKAAAQAARGAAEEARELARPTGDGFAPDVLTALANLAKSVDQIERRLTVETVARTKTAELLADLVRSVDRVERRLTAETVARTKTAELLAEHFADHARAGGIGRGAH